VIPKQVLPNLDPAPTGFEFLYPARSGTILNPTYNSRCLPLIHCRLNQSINQPEIFKVALVVSTAAKSTEEVINVQEGYLTSKQYVGNDSMKR